MSMDANQYCTRNIGPVDKTGSGPMLPAQVVTVTVSSSFSVCRVGMLFMPTKTNIMIPPNSKVGKKAYPPYIIDSKGTG